MKINDSEILYFASKGKAGEVYGMTFDGDKKNLYRVDYKGFELVHFEIPFGNDEYKDIISRMIKGDLSDPNNRLNGSKALEGIIKHSSTKKTINPIENR
jgi:hypothetical protein